jgi:hypothetical protein
MLGDNPERSRNPLKKAMRRRNVKTVQFTDPTYYEAEQIDYSSEEEMGEDDLDFLTTADVAREDEQLQQDQHVGLQQQQQHGQQQEKQQQSQEQIYADNTVQPLRVRGVAARDERQENVNGTNGVQQSSHVDPRIDRPRISEESAADSGMDALRKSRLLPNSVQKIAAASVATGACEIPTRFTRTIALKLVKSVLLRIYFETTRRLRIPRGLM